MKKLILFLGLMLVGFAMAEYSNESEHGVEYYYIPQGDGTDISEVIAATDEGKALVPVASIGGLF